MTEIETSAAQDTRTPPAPRKKRTAGYYAASFFLKLGVTALAVFLLLKFVVGIHVCHVNSAYPSVRDGDLCMTLRLASPKQGDMVVYRYNNEIHYGRAVAFGGDEVDTISGHQIKVGATGSVTKYYYLRDGQYVTIEGLPQGAHYELTEDAEDYTSSEHTDRVVRPADPENNIAEKKYDDNTASTIAADDIYTGYTNTRVGNIPTGVATAVAGSAVIVAAGVAGIVIGVLNVKKKEHGDK